MTLKEELNALKPLMGSSKPEERARMTELEKEFGNMQMTEEEQEYAARWWMQGTEELREEIRELRRQIDKESAR